MEFSEQHGSILCYPVFISTGIFSHQLNINLRFWSEVSGGSCFCLCLCWCPQLGGARGPRGPQVSISERQEVAVFQGEVEEEDGQQLHKYCHPPFLPISHLCCGGADTWSGLMSPRATESLKQRRVGAGPTGRTSKGSGTSETEKQLHKQGNDGEHSKQQPGTRIQRFHVLLLISRCFTGILPHVWI